MVASGHVVQYESCCFYDEPTLMFNIVSVYSVCDYNKYTWEIVLEGVPHEDFSEHLVKKYITLNVFTLRSRRTRPHSALARTYKWVNFLFPFSIIKFP